jgi:hypothetical protein
VTNEEPQIHSHLTDELPKDHPLAWEQVSCDACGTLVHAGNNECMTTWIEFGNANVCAQCLGTLPDVMYSNTWVAPAAGAGESK